MEIKTLGRHIQVGGFESAKLKYVYLKESEGTFDKYTMQNEKNCKINDFGKVVLRYYFGLF